ncbi:MAG TPA: metalloregulator ArsR/SmtB family transcription factor [Pseudobacteroides sp.]|uniref:ArsR/SmtB family transcription factor n=1 Tax=Pseudobacteroides sp. TaxID=1968840 RepID=UPI002F944CD8
MDDLLDLFSILSDRTRLRILLLLLNNELCVCEIFAALDMSQPRVSRQLAILKQSKIIKDRREGKWVYYRIDENEYTKHLLSILSLLPGWLCGDAEFNNDKSMLHKIAALKSKAPSCKCLLTGGGRHGE